MARLFVDLTEDEQWCNGKINVRIERDSLTGVHEALKIGDEIELVLSVRQVITLFDCLDGWLNGGPVKAIGDIERRIIEVVKETTEDHAVTMRSLQQRPEEFAHYLYEMMKLKGIRFRLHQEP